MTAYDGLGLPYTVSNPYRSTSDPTYGLTAYTYDAFGRTTLLKHPDGTTMQTKYTDRATQLMDEGNGTRAVQRISQSDGLGRLTSVCEVTSSTQLGITPTPTGCGQDIAATGFLTTYNFDTLDNLLSVSQGGLSSRSFAYDALSQVTSAANPESGLTTYTYDANGNLATRTQPEPNQTNPSTTVTTTYQYDVLNRMTERDYSDSTIGADFQYDETSPWGFTLTNPIGRLTSEYNGNTGAVFSYDPMGRVARNDQCTPQNCGTGDFEMLYTYDLFGDMRSSTDGQFDLFSDTYNAAAQLVSLVSSLSDSNHPGTLFSSATYDAPGQLTSAKFGNGITENRNYNSRLETTSLSAGSVYSASLGYAPNGDVSSANDSVNGSWTYSYDDFNRLASATGPGQAYTYTYAYDRYGNRWNQKLSGSCTSGSAICLTFDANNHINNGIETYDAAGNLMTDGFHNYFYDAEHHLVQVDGSAGYCQSGTGTQATACYTYDAEGRRVRRAVPGSGITDDYLYDLAGHFITQVSGSGWWARGEIYAGGQHIATYENDLQTPTTFFTHADWLGTERVQTSVNGAACETITSLPFGDGLNTSGSCDPTALRFTGKMRDWETNLDNFGARYNSSDLGRFTSPDPLLNSGRPNNPQTWNRYAYALNNPLGIVDPTGLYDLQNPCAQGDSQCLYQYAQQAKTLAKGLKNLAKQVSRMKNGPEKERLQAALTAFGTEGDHNGVTATFGALGGDAAAQTDFHADANGLLSATVTFDPNKIGLDQGEYAIDAAHEGTHIEDFTTQAINDEITDGSLPPLSPFSTEYRGYQTSIFAASALGRTSFSRSYDGVDYMLWNGSWGRVDANITNFVTKSHDQNGKLDHPETSPHNPWPNN